MQRLSKIESAHHRAWLSEWRTPTAMVAYLRDVNDAMGPDFFFRQSGVEFLRDAWIAAEFGRHRQSPIIRLVPEHDRWPEFEARSIESAIERVECVEADVPGRRRSDDYRGTKIQSLSGEPNVEHDPVENWIARADQVPAALSAAIATKIQKHYAAGASLLVYLNNQEYGIRQTEIEKAMLPAVLPASPIFNGCGCSGRSNYMVPGARKASDGSRKPNSR
jgi:hypothetical protein